MRVSHKVTIDAPASAVWDLLGEPSLYPRFLRDVTHAEPDNIKANYTLALAYRAKRDLAQNAPADFEKNNKDMKESYVRALSGRAFTDDDYTTQGNAAFELDGLRQPNALHAALALYDQALRINPHAVYALSGRADVYKKSRHYQLAVENYNAARRLHPHDKELLQRLTEARTLLAFGG